MSDPIRAALDKAACEICICEGECFETRHGMMHGPCEKFTGEAADVIATFLRALPNTSTAMILSECSGGMTSRPGIGQTCSWWAGPLAQAVLAAAKEERE
jgi:hypothetical protein